MSEFELDGVNGDDEVPPHEHPDLESHIEELAAAVMGPSRSDFSGGGRYEEMGLVHKVDRLLEEGIKIRIPWPLWAAIVSALGGLIAQLIATFGGPG